MATARGPSFSILSRLQAGSAGLLLSLELAHKWLEPAAGEPLPLPSFLRVHVADALARYAGARAWVTGHPRATLALAVLTAVAATVAYRF
ncbi:MAG TPA: hypothetical protein VIV57_19295 [Anaeromyxobacter sp.]